MLLQPLRRPSHSHDDWGYRIEKFLVDENVNAGVRIFEGTGEHLCEQINRVGKDVQVLADEHDLLFEEHR